MRPNITEVQVIPLKPKDGLVALASCVYDRSLYLGSIGIYTKLSGGYRLAYPTKKTSSTTTINIFHPINKDIAEKIEQEIIGKYEELTKQ